MGMGASDFMNNRLGTSGRLLEADTGGGGGGGSGAGAAVVAQRDHLPALDVWRGLAILSLLVGHFIGVPGLEAGHLGVELFFVLSGFLIVQILFVKKSPLKSFFFRRVTRILPAALTYLLVLTAIYLVRYHTTRGFKALLACYLFFVNYVMALKLGSPPISAGHLWSLCVEEHTYVLLGVGAIACRRWKIDPLYLIGAGIVFSIGRALKVGSATHWDYFATYWRTDCRLSSILFGGLAALAIDRGLGGKTAYAGIPSSWLAVVLLVAGIFCQMTGVHPFFRHTVGTALLAVAMLLVAQHGHHPFWRWRPLTFLGVTSFSLYLWQEPFSDNHALHGLNVWIALTGAFLTAMASYYLVETPARRFLNRRWGPRPHQPSFSRPAPSQPSPSPRYR
jgi:peptidoglycan/LPS O-acetylase OafA/YrhL